MSHYWPHLVARFRSSTQSVFWGQKSSNAGSISIDVADDASLATLPKLTKGTRKDAGFTLIEIMVVIAIIGILATLIVPKIMGRPDEARATAAKHDVGTLVQAFKLYRLDIGRYPTTEQGVKALVEKPTSEPVPQNWKAGGYLDSIPKDPWGNPYQYANPGTRSEIDVYSFGADGKPGGTGNDADIGNWQ